MLDKYRHHYNDILEYIHKRVVSGATPMQIAVEVQEKHSIHIFFPTLDKKYIFELISMLAEQAYFTYNNKLYKE